jgi:hypothetical protein
MSVGYRFLCIIVEGPRSSWEDGNGIQRASRSRGQVYPGVKSISRGQVYPGVKSIQGSSLYPGVKSISRGQVDVCVDFKSIGKFIF